MKLNIDDPCYQIHREREHFATLFIIIYKVDIKNDNLVFSRCQERREREQQEMESAKEIADDDFDGFP